MSAIATKTDAPAALHDIAALLAELGDVPVITEAQRDYAASDVRYLHRLHDVFIERLAREGVKSEI